MKKVLMMIAAIVGMATAGQANTGTHGAIRAKAPVAQQACAKADSEGFCGLTLLRATRTSVTGPATTNGDSRAQLNRLIASLN